MEPSQEAGAGTASAPMCATHQEASSGACERCGVFTCVLCPAGAHRCERCEEQEFTRASAARLVGGPAFLLMALAALGLALSSVWLYGLLTGSRASGWESSYLLAVAGCGVSALVLAGGIQMRRLRSYPMAVLASLMALIVLLPMAGLGLVIGGTALWTLSRASVRAGFRVHDKR